MGAESIPSTSKKLGTFFLSPWTMSGILRRRGRLKQRVSERTIGYVVFVLTI
jgi:hypothetical protein